MLQPDPTPCPGTAHAGRLHWCAVDEGWVCFDVRTNSSFLLPPLARWICEQEPRAAADEHGLWQRLRAETGEAEADCQEAVRECLAPLREAGLIGPSEPGSLC